MGMALYGLTQFSIIFNKDSREVESKSTIKPFVGVIIL